MPKKILPFEGKARDNLITFSAGAGLNDTGEEMHSPFLAYYAGNMLGVTPEQYGLIEGIAEVINRILRGFTGYISDHWNRKAPVVLGYILIAISRLGLSLVRGWAGFIPMRGLRQVGRALHDPAREASIEESVPTQQRGRAFRLLNAVDTVGAIIGPVIGLLILSSATAGYFNIKFISHSARTTFSSESYIWLFMWASIPTILSSWIIWFFLRETREKPKTPTLLLYKQPSLFSKFLSGIKQFVNNVRGYFVHKQLRYVTISHMLLAIAAVPMQMILFYIYSEKSGLGATPLVGAILFITYSIVGFLSSYPAGMVVNRLGRFKSQLIANILCIIALFSLALIKSPLLMLIPIILYSVFHSLWLVTRRNIIADLAPANVRGQILGTFSMLYGLVSSLSPIMVGFLWYRITPAFAFTTMALIGIAATVLLIITQGKRK